MPECTILDFPRYWEIFNVHTAETFECVFGTKAHVDAYVTAHYGAHWDYELSESSQFDPASDRNV